MAGKKRKYTIIVEDIDDAELPDDQHASSTAPIAAAVDEAPAAPHVEHNDPIVEEMAEVRRIVDAMETVRNVTKEQRSTIDTPAESNDEVKPVVDEVQDEAEDSDCMIVESRWVRKSGKQAAKRVKEENVKEDPEPPAQTQTEHATDTSATQETIGQPAEPDPPIVETTSEVVNSAVSAVTEPRRTRSGQQPERREAIPEDRGLDEDSTSDYTSDNSTLPTSNGDTEDRDDSNSAWDTVSESEDQTTAKRTIKYLTNYKRLPASAPPNHAHITFDKFGLPLGNYDISDAEKWLPDILVSAIKKHTVKALDNFLSLHYERFWFNCRMFITDRTRYSYSIARYGTMVEVALHDNLLTPKDPNDLEWTRENIKHNFVATIQLRFNGARSPWTLLGHTLSWTPPPSLIWKLPPKGLTTELQARSFYEYIQQQTFEQDHYHALEIAYGDKLVFDMTKDCVIGKLVSEQSGVLGNVN